MLLRRYWGTWEHDINEDGLDAGSAGSSEKIGRAWWKAFKHVKEQVDLVARKKFGGCLSLK